MLNKTKDPKIALMIEAMNIPIFADSISCKLSRKASSVINIETVKPMPAIRPTPTICVQLVPAGSWPLPKRTKSQEAPKMPIIFPTARPSIIPSITLADDGSLKASVDKATPAFANATARNL